MKGDRPQGSIHPTLSPFNECVLALFLIAAVPGRCGAAAGVIRVSPGGPVRSLQKAIDMAGPGTVIQAARGIYREGVVFTKSGSRQGQQAHRRDAAGLRTPPQEGCTPLKLLDHKPVEEGGPITIENIPAVRRRSRFLHATGRLLVDGD